MERNKSFIERIKPRTVGEKMFTAGFGVDLGVIVISVTLGHLQDESVTHLTPEQIHTMKNILLFGGHIILSDAILKLGGVVKMKYFEEENWLRGRGS